MLGPRQVGKTWLIDKCLHNKKATISIPLQNPSIRQEFERDPSLLIRRAEAIDGHTLIFIDEAQKVPEIFDAAQVLIDSNKATVIFSGSSARKLRKKGANLLPGRILSYRLDPLMWCETGWLTKSSIPQLKIHENHDPSHYTFDDSMIYGSLPGIASEQDAQDRVQLLRSYAHIYIEEEIRIEAFSRNLGAFSRFLELAASESGTAPNLHKLSMESGVSAPTVKEYYAILEDTLVVETVAPYLKNARKRILQTPRYYFFDLGVRNALARVPMTPDLIQAQKGLLFEHAVMLEIIRRIRALRQDYRVCFWRTSGGYEVDCVIDCGTYVVPIEIKSARHVALADLHGLMTFLDDYAGVAKHGFVVFMGSAPEKLAPNITAIPWHML
jgi:predicted AAA+ superfamily ATPase